MAKYKIMEKDKPDLDWAESDFIAAGLNSICVGNLRIQLTEDERRNIERIWRMIDNGELSNG